MTSLRIHLLRPGVAWGGTGGSSRYVTALGQALVESGHDVVLSKPFGRGGIRRRGLFLSWAATGSPCIRGTSGAVGLIHSVESVVVPRACQSPLVVTAHDVCALRHPSLVSPQLAMLKRLSWRRAGSWDAIVVPSNATAKDVQELGVDPARVHVIRHGIPTVFSDEPAEDHRAEVKSLTAGRPFLVAVLPHGSKKKGADLLRRAWASLRHSGGRLVWVGGPTRDPGVVTLHGVQDPLLAALYRGARALVVPSRCEGYSLPIAEALAAGTPVIASDIPAHREFADEAMRFFPPGDLEALRGSMLGALQDEWPRNDPHSFPGMDEMAAEHLRVYERVVS